MTIEPPAPRSVGQLVATIILLVVMVVYATYSGFAGLLLGFASDACEPGACNFDGLTVGMLISVFGVATLAIAALVIAIVRLVRRRRAPWLVPILGGLGVTVIWWIGALIVGFSTTFAVL